MKNLTMKYRCPAPDSAEGWEKESLPIGNGYLGANVFGIVERERIQLTHNALVNPQYDEEDRMFGGLNNLAEVYIHFPHKEVSDYERGLCLNDAVAYCRYRCDGVSYTREYFASYPDKVVAVRMEASEKGKLDFKLTPQIPYLKDYAFKEGDHGGKSGEIRVAGDTIFRRGKLHFYNILFEAQIKIITDGRTRPVYESLDTPVGEGLQVMGATWATILITADTNYKLCSEVFWEKDREKKCKGKDPHEKVSEVLAAASAKNYTVLKQRHMEDYRRLFNRVSLSLGEYKEGCVEDMMKCYREGSSEPYLEELYFQYGRYLLISSSRKGGLPANLQGIWNCHDFSPWGSGYWHNINVQMNYWPAFNTNLLETFEPYMDYFQAYVSKAQEFAGEYIQEHNPSNYRAQKGECGWTIGTAGYPYFITAPGGHSGPGTGALTSKLFWEAYAFSCDRNVLKNVTYPALLGMSKFLTKTVKAYDGKYMVTPSASPEQMNNGAYIDGGSYYRTVGCAFDQQMIYENGRDLLEAAKLLEEDGFMQSEDEAVEIQRQQIDQYEPVEVGWSGQIKEFSEERFYGEIGEYHHRHISHLMGLYPGRSINASTPVWLDAARTSLTKRGNDTTGWALAHRLNAWARLGEGERAYEVLRKLLTEKTMVNLWDLHPPFQIDGNFGATAGIAEMLLQSHNDYIEILPALPKDWECGAFEGLRARGGFEVSARWEHGCVKHITVKSLCGNTVRILCEGIEEVSHEIFAGKSREMICGRMISQDMIELCTVEGESYTFENIPKRLRVKEVDDLVVGTKQKVTLKWKSDMPVNIYRAVDGEPTYIPIAQDIRDKRYVDDIDFDKFEIITYKVKAVCGKTESKGVCRTINHATRLDIDRYEMMLGAKKQH